MEANCVEIFASVQGEGLYVGRSTVFVRLGECDLRCRWCDSPGTWRPVPSCRIEREPGTARFRNVPNPIDEKTLAAALDVLAPRRDGHLSLTGGEPLLQPEVVREAAALGRARGLRVYLETHGLATTALERVVDAVDVVSMDWKLASDVRRAGTRSGDEVSFASEHARFLALAHARSEVFVKVVLTPNTGDEELLEVCDQISSCSKSIPLVLQPVTPTAAVPWAPDAQRLLGWLAACEERLPDVRLIPQTHPLLGAL